VVFLVEPSDRALVDRQQLGLLMVALERIDEALRFGPSAEADEALADGLERLGSCYGTLSLQTSPEVCGHLDAAYDACLRGLGDACCGRTEALAIAVAIVRSIHGVLSPPLVVSRAA
jgi:hypothetical protein